MQIEIVDDGSGLDDLASEWADLRRRSVDNHYGPSIDAARDAWRYLAGQGAFRLRIVVGRHSGRMVLAWPLLIHRRLAWRQATWLGVRNEYRDVLVEQAPQRPEWIEAAWHVVKSRLGVDLVSCPCVRDDAAAFTILDREASAAVRRDTTLFLPVGQWPDWEGYFPTLSRKFRRDQERRERRLAERGDVVFEFVDDAAGIDRSLRWMFARKKAWARRMHLRENYSDDYRHYLNAVSRHALSSGTLLFGILRLNDDILAAVLGLARSSHMTMVLTSYDRAWMSFGPGRLLIERMLRWAFERKLTVVDFGIGTETYKYTLTAHEAPLSSYLVPCTRWGAAYVTWYRSPLRDLLKGAYRRMPVRIQRAVRADSP